MHRTLNTLLVALIATAMTAAFAQPASSDSSFDWSERGRSVYNQHCSSCHGPEGAGIPGAFPPLADHVPDLLIPEGGSTYLADVMLYGLQGAIEVNGAAYNGAMPAWPQLSDEEVAAVLNHIATAWGNTDALPADTVLFAPADVAAERDKGLTGADVLALRTALLSAEVVEVAEFAVLSDEVGYYTAAQAATGKAAYEQHCASCHGETLRGGPHEPPLTQLSFFRKWGDQTFDALYGYYSATMPFSQASRLRPSEYVAIGAYWLEFHNYPAGDVPLTDDPNQMRQIVIERGR
ncbi:MAG: c-type cytochrome [Trueperaceae bacterium]